MTSILILGAGELGSSVIRALHTQKTTSPQQIASLTVLLRSDSKTAQSPWVKELGVRVLPGDLVGTSQSGLATLFAPYDVIVGCTGFGSEKGLQLKIARAVLEAAEIDKARGGGRVGRRYFPWQFGVDYDVIGRGSGQDLFDEQLDVRALLRKEAEQSGVEWVIVSTGMFMGFLFEEWFGIVDLGANPVVRALGGWENQVTLTTVEDVGLLTARILVHEPRVKNQVVFVAGDTVTFERLANLVSKAIQKPVQKEVLTVDDLKNALQQNPNDGLAKYRLVFAKGVGVAWNFEETFNWKNRVPVKNVDDWVLENLKV